MVLRARYLALGTLLAVIAISAVVLNFGSQTSETTKKITVLEDSWVYDSAPQTNYGSWTKINIETTEGGHACAWLKFDLNSLPTGISIETAKVCLYSCELHKVGDVKIRYAQCDTWCETTITNTTAPTFSSTLDSTTVNLANRQYSWTVTTAARTAYATDKTLSFVLEGDGWVYFDSKEGTNPPYLEITYTPQT